MRTASVNVAPAAHATGLPSRYSVTTNPPATMDAPQERPDERRNLPRDARVMHYEYDKTRRVSTFLFTKFEKLRNEKLDRYEIAA
jgi:hypothetical protein